MKKSIIKLAILFIIFSVNLCANVHGFTSRFNKIWNVVYEFEGNKIVNNSLEHSKYGITNITLNWYNKEHDTDYTVDSLTYNKAKLIAYKMFYKKAKLDKIKSDRVALVMFDWIYNGGFYNASKELQILVNERINIINNKYNTDFSDIEVDGVLGSETIEAVNILTSNKYDILDESTFVEILVTKRLSQYNKFRDWDIYRTSWLYRINKTFYTWNKEKAVLSK